MILELLDRNKNISTLTGIHEIPADLSSICSIQVIDYGKEDILQLEQLFNIDAAILNNSEDIEISSHYLENEDQLAFNFSFPYFTPLNKIDEIVLSFILKKDILFSFMRINFEQFIPESKKLNHLENIKAGAFTLDEFLLLLIGIIPDYFADITELTGKKIKTIYSGLLQQQQYSGRELDEITAFKFNNLLLKESLNEFRRVLHLLRKSKKLSTAIKEHIAIELDDLNVVSEYVQNNFERLEDLKEYVSNKIELDQNKIFKTLTIITMCISLPMLVAGIYGMNFKFMPELEWKYGYIYVIILLLTCFIAPLIWFKRKKWF
ncbi:CorA family divalent cation transporter [Chitinophaga sp.]|uniref:CorA family divalent cation transporter n=1 Tax=Chitinophaga sp. TaxID=1869181 RepID=UPI002F93B420